MRRAARRDANHATIRDALRAASYAVSDLGTAGPGVPDLYVSRRGVGRWVEIKDAASRPLKLRGERQAAIHARQQAFRDLHAGLVLVATTAAEVTAHFETATPLPT